MQTSAGSTGALTEDGHLVGVAAERSDVLLYPLQRQGLVVQTSVAKVCVILSVQET